MTPVGYRHTNSKGITYYLNSKQVTLRGNRKQVIFYFTRDIRPHHCDLPAGHEVSENPRNGFLALRKVF
ncbi:hypothetical protein EKK58_09650 [Candidatus Dependentiae bacterium]|nr:MAG: hypothetical protein EKK58_09650 [Candidatus Dependentiae bacterium]